MCDWNPDLAQLMAGASHATRRDEAVPPQVLVVVASRFARVAWKYEAIAYALMLKNLGCLYQTMYLVATAMGLAPCALGTGNADLFSQLIGSEYYAETSIGEFTLGSVPECLADEPKQLMMEPVDWQA
ncbi:MAG: SagB/ThcOx family dehydrogenase [Synechococcales cyanobacterium RU_4_20]|nr:SagB/ThcOx family dehydrogenase [Synechococcales cyanobacterium RU_4_20]